MYDQSQLSIIRKRKRVDSAKNSNKNSKKSTLKISCLETRIILHHRSSRSTHSEPTDTTNICRRNKNFNLRDTRVEHADSRKNSSSGWIRISDRQVRLPVWPRVLPRTRLQFPPHSIFTVWTPSVHLFPQVSWSRKGEERVLLARRISRIFVMEGGGARVALPPLPVARPANARLLFGHVEIATWTAELERDKGELGWKLGVRVHLRVKFSRGFFSNGR